MSWMRGAAGVPGLGGEVILPAYPTERAPAPRGLGYDGSPGEPPVHQVVSFGAERPVRTPPGELVPGHVSGYAPGRVSNHNVFQDAAVSLSELLGGQPVYLRQSPPGVGTDLPPVPDLVVISPDLGPPGTLAPEPRRRRRGLLGKIRELLDGTR
jgi:hypothetical protein